VYVAWWIAYHLRGDGISGWPHPDGAGHNPQPRETVSPSIPQVHALLLCHLATTVIIHLHDSIGIALAMLLYTKPRHLQTCASMAMAGCAGWSQRARPLLLQGVRRRLMNPGSSYTCAAGLIHASSGYQMERGQQHVRMCDLDSPICCGPRKKERVKHTSWR
jgi:hypothetical protein